MAGNILFAAIFGIALVAQLVLAVWYKTRGFANTMVCGSIVESVSRVLVRSHMFDFNYFAVYISPLPSVQVRANFRCQIPRVPHH
jgi:hypothetical protein